MHSVSAAQWTHTAQNHSCSVETHCTNSQLLSGHTLHKVSAAQWTHIAQNHSCSVETHCTKSQLLSGHTLHKVSAAQWTHTAQSLSCSVNTHCTKSQLLSGHTLHKVSAAQWTHTAQSLSCSVDTHCTKSHLLIGHTLHTVTAAQWTHTAVTSAHWTHNQKKKFWEPLPKKTACWIIIQNKDAQFHTLEATEPGSTDAAKVCHTAVLLVLSGSHISCQTRCSYPTTTKFTTQSNTWNTTPLEETAQNIMAHLRIAATCVPQPGTCSAMPATGDDHVVRLQISSLGKAEIAIQCQNTVWTHLLVGAGFYCQLQKLESVMPPETQFNWGLGWTISVPADTLKLHSRWMQNECRGLVLLISVGNFEM